MLRQFRSGANGLFAKILLALLVASFALWGIGDIFRMGGDDAVAIVDGDPITSAELRFTIQQMQEQYAELTPDVAQSLPVQLQTLNRLINTRLLAKEADALGIMFSDEILTQRIASDALFQDANGNFSRDKFTLLLAQNNLSQGEFLRRYGRDMQLRVTEAIATQSVNAPKEMVELTYYVQEEQREASLILLGPDDIGSIADPDEEAIQALYDASAERYRLPEYRTYRYVYFDANSVAGLLNLEPTADEISSYYEVNATDFDRPETRELIQLLFENKENAAAIRAKLAALAEQGTELSEDNLKAFAAGEKTILNGDFIGSAASTQADLQPSISGAAFALEAGGITEPLETELGWQLVVVESINPSYRLPLDDVKNEIRDLLLAQRVEDALTELSNKLDDTIAAGASLDEALTQNGLDSLKLETLGPISATNQLRNGETFEMKPYELEMLGMAFEQDEGEISPISLSADSRYFIVETLEVIPSELPELDAVKSKLVSEWKEEQTREALLEKSVELEQALREAESPLAAVKERGLSLHATGKLKRHHDTVSNQSQIKDKILTSDFVQALFTLKPNEISMPYPLPSGEYAIGILDAIHAAEPPTDVALANLSAQLDMQLTQQVLSAYLSALREKYSVEIMLDKLATDAAADLDS